jgi:subtilisin family serine protease
MNRFSLSLACAIALALAMPASFAADGAVPVVRLVVHDRSELPRHDYPLTEPAASLLLTDDEAFDKLAGVVRQDTEETLRQYDIQDKTILRDFYAVLRDLALLRGDGATALNYDSRIRMATGDLSSKLLSGLIQDSVAMAMMSGTVPGQRQVAYRENLSQQLAAMPWDTVRRDIKAMKERAETPNRPNLLTGMIQASIDPIAEQTGSITWQAAADLISVRVYQRLINGYQAETVAALDGYVRSHMLTEPDIWSARSVALEQDNGLTPVLVAVWDEGIDASLFRNAFQVAGKSPPARSEAMHGVSAIAANGNPAARMVTVRYDASDKHTASTDFAPDVASRYAANVRRIVDDLKAQHVRVVNISWGDSLAFIEQSLEAEGVGNNAGERKAMAKQAFRAESVALASAIRGAPDILFIPAAGTVDADANLAATIPADIDLPNVLAVGAVDQAGNEADFTSYGKRVRVYADGFQVASVDGHGGKLAGTTIAAPQVTNLAAKLLALDPSLTPADVIRLIVDGASKSDDGKRLLIDPKHSIALARPQA